LPALVLILFIATEAVLKSYLKTFLHPYCLAVLFLCLAYFLWYFNQNRRGSELWESFTSATPAVKWNTVIVASIILLGAFFRFWKLGSLFDGMTYDEAYKGLDAIAIREFGDRPIFLDWNGGREALVAYAVAATQPFLDYTNLSVRTITALTGCISLLFFYLFTRRIFNNNIALVSTFLLAVSKWHIIHTRYGVRAGLYPAFELGTLYFLSRGLDSERRRTGSLIAAGVIGALGLYTYIAYRIFPFVVLAYLLEKVVRKHLRPQMKGILAAAVVSLLIIAPLARFYMEHAESLTDRMKRTQVWRQHPGKEGAGPVSLVLDSAARTFGMFTYRGDAIARHNIKEEPMLSPFLTAFFILGFFLTILNFRAKYARFLLLYFFLTLLPGILSVGAPNVPRVFGSLPVAFLFTAFGMFGAASILRRSAVLLPKLLIAIALSGSFLTGMLDTLVRFPAILDSLSPRLAALWGMDRDQENVARLSNALGDRCEIYLPPQFYFHATIEYLTYSKSRHKLVTPHTDFREASSNKVFVVILQPDQINPWWLRDDEGKRFYKWWQQVHQIEPREMRTAIRRTYDPPFTKTSDWRIARMIEQNFPDARHLRFGNFSAMVFRPPRH
jgi:hypothetical protein